MQIFQEKSIFFTKNQFFNEKSNFFHEKINFFELWMRFSESTRKMLQNGGVESVWGALGVCFLRVSHMGNHTKAFWGISLLISNSVEYKTAIEISDFWKRFMPPKHAKIIEICMALGFWGLRASECAVFPRENHDSEMRDTDRGKCEEAARKQRVSSKEAARKQQGSIFTCRCP